MERVKSFSGEKIFNSVFFSFLAIYIIFVILLIGGTLFYTDVSTIWKNFMLENTLFAIKLSLWTSLLSTALAVIVAIPAGYCLSRYNFIGKSIVGIIIDLPIVLPPLIVGLCLLMFFNTRFGEFINENIIRFIFSVPGIVLAQFSISASFAIIAIRTAFDNVNPRYEFAARTMGCNKVQAFVRVVLPLVKGGIISGSVMTWTRAVGEFVPILLICGATRGKTTIMPIAIFLEFEIGNIEGAVGLTIIFLVLSILYLLLFKNFGLMVGTGLKKGLKEATYE
jgi:molybdate transport system permease protein